MLGIHTSKSIVSSKFCPMKLRQNFVKCFVRFLGNGVSRENAFEIYRPLASKQVGDVFNSLGLS